MKKSSQNQLILSDVSQQIQIATAANSDLNF